MQPNWDEAAEHWDELIKNPSSPHFFYYKSADFFIQEKIRNKQRVLELGCGTSQCLLDINVSEKCQIVVSDYSLSMVHAAREKIKKSEIRQKVQFARLDAQNIPFGKQSFDMVFSRGVLLSYVERPDKLLAECYRVLERGGVVVMDSMNLAGREYILRKIGISKGKGYYQEIFTKGRFQHGVIRELSPEGTILGKYGLADRTVILKEKPEDLEKETLKMTKTKTRMFKKKEIEKMFEESGFVEVSTYPLGHMFMIARNKNLRNEMIRNRDFVCKIQKEIAPYLKPETGIHLITLGKKP